MNIKDYIKDFKLFPLVKGEFVLPTTKKEFVKKVNATTERGFNLVGSFNVEGEKHNHDYQSEIDGNNVKFRQIQSRRSEDEILVGAVTGYRRSMFTGTIIYSKLTETAENNLVFKYYIVFNVFSNLICLLFILGNLYAIVILLTSGFSDINIKILLVCLLGYIICLTTFNSYARTNASFIKSLVNDAADA